MNPYILTPDLNGEGLHIGIVRARFNEEVGQAGIGAQILRDLNVGQMRLLARPRKMPSMAGFSLT
ncbi:hypothetical protein CTI14_53605, partial [Methylobacterium radiotolerans]